MITCPNCGAGNKPGSSACRMCATSLVGIVEAPAPRVQTPGSSSPHTPEPDSHHPEEVKPPVEQEGIVCSECNTMNEPGWSFCQQCGKRLTQAAPAPPPQPPAASGIPAGLRTVPEQHAVVDPSVVQGLKTNPDPQPAEHWLKTVVAQPLEQSLKTVADNRPPVVEPKVVPKHPLPAAPPTVADRQPMAEPREREPDDSASRTVPVEPPVQPKPTAPTPAPPVQPKPVAATPPPPIPKPSIPPPPSAPPVSAPEPMIQHGQSMSGVLCTQCGQSNSVGSAFCASCGTPITFGKTMVISSQAAPPKGRLHLVMEGGQPGEVYELDDDTVIGRSNGEITFPHDGFMSGRHARIERRGSSFILTDEGSRNGTFIKLKGEVELKPGDMILVGKQLFRFEV
jgi:hypothetical protein